ncbi:MAG: 30S ribosomal protein S12 methylthiotransferase RimO [Ignavibacteriae bacterium]|nr:30S ribosomal protein S12 methylthiotransferase RimO [Ignavibacteriota bacterium]
MSEITQTSKINVITLGCWKNTVDSENLLGQLALNNATIVENSDDADTVVINTCGFIDAAKQESIDTIMEAVERKNEGKLKKVIVMGCLSERYKNDLITEIPQVDAYFGTNQLREVLKELDARYKYELLGERALTTPSHFAYMKISEGCDHPCSFCAIPIMRGKHATKPQEEILAEAYRLAAKGVKELILIAQDSTYYGVDLYGERRLGSLLQELSAVDGIEWIRLIYAYPAKFPREILSVMKNNPKICRYLDIPVQHASDDVLKSMRRGITNRALRELLSSIKSEVPGVALRTTLIVGYPNETEQDFQTLCDFVREMQFHRLGVFTYSEEEGTTAAPLGDPIPNEVKEERKATIMEIQKDISEERNSRLIGSRAKVLIDRHEASFAVGRTQWDAPEIDQEVYVKNGSQLRVGNFYDVKIVENTEYDLYAEQS